MSKLQIHAAQVQHLYKSFSSFFIANNYKTSVGLVRRNNWERKILVICIVKQDYDISVRLVSEL